VGKIVSKMISRGDIRRDGRALYLTINGERRLRVQGVHKPTLYRWVPAPGRYIIVPHPAHHGSWQHYPECAYAEGLATHPDKQRQGIAISLMQSTEAYARRHQAESIGLSVGTDNLPAQALYRKIAYQPTDIPSYLVTWNYLDKITGEVKEEGELCNFWLKQLDEVLSSAPNVLWIPFRKATPTDAYVINGIITR
jgi:GNAT superfamily N-acetyltransferase